MEVAGALARWRLLGRLHGGGCGGHCVLEVAEAFAHCGMLRRLGVLELMVSETALNGRCQEMLAINRSK